MRTATAAETTVLEGYDRQELLRVQIADHTDTLVDYTVAGGAERDWVTGVGVTTNIDQPASTASVNLHREVAGTSLAPGMNDDDPIAAGRRVLIAVAVIEQSATVVADDWHPIFEGTIDTVAWGGNDSQMSLACRDKMGEILDAWIETKAEYGGSVGTPTPMEDVIQSLADDVLGSGAVTVVTPTSPSFGIVAFNQKIQSLRQAHQALIDLIGWDLRYIYSQAASAWQYTLRNPERNKTVPDHTFTADDYFTVSDIQESTTGIRNVGIIEVVVGDTVVTVTAEDSDSIAEYRRRPIFLDASGDPQMDTEAKATDLIGAVVQDLAQPLLQKQVVGPVDWRFELGDLLRWTANSIHSAADLDQAIVGFQHDFGPEGNSTTYLTRGSPSGGVTRWHRRERLLEEEAPGLQVPSLDITDESEDGTDGSMEVTVYDPDALTTRLEYRTKEGAGDWTAWTTETIAPAHETAYVTTVPLASGHLSFIQWRLSWIIRGEQGIEVVTSAGFDIGNIPTGQIVPVIDETDGGLSAALNGDFDTSSWKILASTTKLDINLTTVRAVTAIAGRVLTPDDVGNLLTLEPGERAYLGALAIGPGGLESPEVIRAEVVFQEIDPSLRVTGESESGSVGTFAVTLDDPGGQADLLEVRTKSGFNVWTPWTTKAAPPANGAEYTDTVTMIDVHPSFIEYRLTWTIHGKVRTMHQKSSGFDIGSVPDGSITPDIDKDGNVSATFKGDFDTQTWKYAVDTLTYPSLETVRTITPTAGRILSPAVVGTLATIDVGETLYISGLPLGVGGVEGELVQVKISRNALRAPTLSVTDESEDAVNGSITVAVFDPDTTADALYYRTKEGTSAWGAWTLKIAPPVDAGTYTETVPLQAGHLSFVEWRLDFSIGGESGSVHLVSGGFDIGRIPTGSITPIVNDDTGAVSVALNGDVDTNSWRVFASTVKADITKGAIRGTASIPGRNPGPGSVGTILTLNFGQTGYIGALAFGADGEESSDIISAEVIFANIAPTMSVTTETETATTGTFGVTIADPAGQADLLEVRTKAGASAWSAWSTKSATPTDGVEYTDTVTLEDIHHSFIEYRLTYTWRGEVTVIHLKSSGFDAGRFPDGTVVPTIDEAGIVSASLKGDFDTQDWKIAADDTGYPSLLTVQGTAALGAGRLVTSDVVGTLLTIDSGQTAFISALPLGAAGIEGALIQVKIASTRNAIKVLSATASIDDSDNVDVAVNCDDEVTIFYVYGNTSAYASAATTKADGTPVSGTSGDVDNVVTALGTGETAFITIVPSNGVLDGPVHQLKTTNSGGGDGESGNYVRIIGARWEFQTISTLRIDVDVEVGPDTDKVGYFYTDPANNSNILPSGTTVGVEATIAGAGVRTHQFTVLASTGGSVVTWDYSADAAWVVVAPFDGAVAGSEKLVNMGAPATMGEGAVRVTGQSGTASLQQTLTTATGSGVDVDASGNVRAKPSDFIKIQATDPSTGWGANEAGYIWVKPV